LKLQKNKEKNKMNDQIILKTVPENVELKPIILVNAKKIVLFRAKELDLANNKTYVRSLLFMVGNELITTNYPDTKLLFAEIKLFEKGNKQNSFTTLEKYDGSINLKLKLTKGHIYITKAEALTISEIYNESKYGVSLQRLLESELKFSPELLTQLLYKSGFLNKIGR